MVTKLDGLVKELSHIYNGIEFTIIEGVDSIKLLCSSFDICDNKKHSSKICKIAKKYLNEKQQNIFSIVYSDRVELLQYKETMRSVQDATKEELLGIIGYIYGYIYGYNNYAEEGLIEDLHNDLTQEMKRYGIDIKDDFKSW